MKYTYQTDGPRGPPAFYWRKNMKHILSCSFGKDSIATALLALQHGEPLDELVYCEVMFNEEISGELPEHNRFIHETTSAASRHGFCAPKRPIYPAFTMLSHEEKPRGCFRDFL